MSLEENKAIVRKFIEAWNGRNLDLMVNLMAVDYYDNYHNLKGSEEYRRFLTSLLKAFPDWHETIEDIVAEGDKVWYRFKATATHTVEYRGYLPSTNRKVRVTPTGKKITLTGVVINRIVDGKIKEGWEVSNLLDNYEQLGIIEYKELPEG